MKNERQEELADLRCIPLAKQNKTKASLLEKGNLLVMTGKCNEFDFSLFHVGPS